MIKACHVKGNQPFIVLFYSKNRSFSGLSCHLLTNEDLHRLYTEHEGFITKSKACHSKGFRGTKIHNFFLYFPAKVEVSLVCLVTHRLAIPLLPAYGA